MAAVEAAAHQAARVEVPEAAAREVVEAAATAAAAVVVPAAAATALAGPAEEAREAVATAREVAAKAAEATGVEAQARAVVVTVRARVAAAVAAEAMAVAAAAAAREKARADAEVAERTGGGRTPSPAIEAQQQWLHEAVMRTTSPSSRHKRGDSVRRRFWSKAAGATRAHPSLRRKGLEPFVAVTPDTCRAMASDEGDEEDEALLDELGLNYPERRVRSEYV